jgi:hypothetical protein
MLQHGFAAAAAAVVVCRGSSRDRPVPPEFMTRYYREPRYKGIPSATLEVSVRRKAWRQCMDPVIGRHMYSSS